MSKGWKIFLWILGILVFIASVGFIIFKMVLSKITVLTPRLTGLNLQGLTLNDLVNIAFSGSEKEINVGLALDIKNDSNLSIPFSINRIQIRRNGTVIAETSAALSGQSFVLPAKGLVSISDTIRILLNTEGAQMLVDKLKKQPIVLNYSVVFNVFGIPFPVKGEFTW